MKTLNIAFVFIIAYFLNAELRAQNSVRETAEADELFEQEDYGAALPLYLRLLSRDPNNPAFNYKTGICYLRSRSQVVKAAPYFEKAIVLGGAYAGSDPTSVPDSPQCVYRLLGDACYASYRFEPAIHAYEKYRELLLLGRSKDQNALDAVNSRIEICRLGKELKDLAPLPQESVREKVKDGTSPKGHNWLPGDYSSTLSNDKSTMILTLKIPVSRYKKNQEDVRYFDPAADHAGPVAVAEYKLPATSSGFDSLMYSATIGASTDGQVVLSYRNENGNAGLYISQLRNDKWTKPERLCKPANSKGWESSESISADGNRLFFVSDREGGLGGSDIYMCEKLPSGEWSRARNLGPAVNTPYNETAPFIHPDGLTLYFSSNRSKPGSYEVFISQRNGDAWSEPVNVGYPINRNDEDIYEITERDKEQDSRPKNKAAKTDSLSEKGLLITVSDERKNSLLLMKGEVRTADENASKPIRITVTDNSSENILNVYYAGKNGKYSFLLPFAKSNNITFEAPGHLFSSEYFLSNKENYFERRERIVLQPLTAGASTRLRNIFFEPNSASIRPASNPELNRLYQLLSSNRNMHAELCNWIYTRTDKKKNRRLSKARAEAVASWVKEKGIAKDQITVKGVCAKPGKRKVKGKPAEMHPDGQQVLVLTITDIKN